MRGLTSSRGVFEAKVSQQQMATSCFTRLRTNAVIRDRSFGCYIVYPAIG